MTALGGQLDVLGAVVASADDDQVLEPAGDEQLVLDHEPEVSGPQEGSLASIRQTRAEDRLGLGGPTPVAARDTRPGDPDLADLARRTGHPGVWVGDRDPLIGYAGTTADKPLSTGFGAGP